MSVGCIIAIVFGALLTIVILCELAETIRLISENDLSEMEDCKKMRLSKRKQIDIYIEKQIEELSERVKVVEFLIENPKGWRIGTYWSIQDGEMYCVEYVKNNHLRCLPIIKCKCANVVETSDGKIQIVKIGDESCVDYAIFDKECEWVKFLCEEKREKQNDEG